VSSSSVFVDDVIVLFVLVLEVVDCVSSEAEVIGAWTVLTVVVVSSGAPDATALCATSLVGVLSMSFGLFALVLLVRVVLLSTATVSSAVATSVLLVDAHAPVRRSAAKPAAARELFISFFIFLTPEFSSVSAPRRGADAALNRKSNA
jgi:hypothetical protein